MGSMVVTAHGAISPDVAWRRYLCPEEWPGWAPHLTEVSSDTPVLQAGTQGTLTMFYLLRADFQVHSVDAGRRAWTWTVGFGPLLLLLEHGLEAHAHGTSAQVRMQGPVVLLLLYRPLMWWALHRLVR